MIFLVVCFGFIIGGANLIYSERRNAQLSAQFAASGIDEFATITEIRYFPGDDDISSYYDVKYEFRIGSGDQHNSETILYEGDDDWLHAPLPVEKILLVELAVGDQVIAQYLPSDPTTNRLRMECPECAEPGGFGDYVGTVFGGLLILVGSLVLWSLRRRLLSKL